MSDKQTRSPRAKKPRQVVMEWLKGRFLLRFHMFWILSGTFLAGLLVTKLLLLVELNNLAVRYGIAVLSSYLVFLGLIRVWLWYIGIACRTPEVDLIDAPDVLELPLRMLSHLDPGASPSTLVPDFGGGNFGGGGASGSWGDALSDAAATPSGGGGGGGGFDLSIDGDEGCAIVLIVLVVAGVLIASIYLIWAAPVILGEAAFEAALAAALVRSAKRVDRQGWVGAVWRATIWPFLGILVLSVALGWAVKNACPEATRLRDVFHCGE